MAYVLSLFPVLACPIGMGLMMWLMARQENPAQGAEDRRGVARANAGQAAAGNRRFHLCLNWKVLASLAVIGAAVWVWVPQLLVVAVPLLIVVACPLSMMFMMRGMHGSRCATAPTRSRQPGPAASADADQLVTLRTQQAALAREIAALEAANSRSLPETEDKRRLIALRHNEER